MLIRKHETQRNTVKKKIGYDTKFEKKGKEP